MQPAFFPLLLIALHVSAPVNCRPGLRGPEEVRRHQLGSTNLGLKADNWAGPRRSNLELNGSMKEGKLRKSLVILPLRTAASNFVSIFDLRRKRFLCMDFKGKLYHSRQKEREDCLYQRVWLAKQQEVFYSSSSGRLLHLEGGGGELTRRDPAEPPAGLLERLLGPLTRRRRRSEEVNPSDPLRTESHPSNPAKDSRDTEPEQDQTGAVSKETIPSCHDPLRVLQPPAPVSPIKDNAEQAKQD